MSISHEAALMALGLTDGDLERVKSAVRHSLDFWYCELRNPDRVNLAYEQYKSWSALLDKLQSLQSL